MSTSEVEEIISRTIAQLQKEEGAVQFKKPKTMQGWLYITLGIGSVVAFLWTSVVFLNNSGTINILAEMESRHSIHATSEELHRREEQLELQIIKEVSPLRQELTAIKQNVKGVEQNVRDVQQDIREVQRSLNHISEKLK
jgi:uncharacterized protein (DUF3084 family)